MDPSTKRILIVLGLIVVVLVALFIVAVAFAPPGDSAQPGCSPDRREAFRERWLRPESVGPGQLQGCTTSLGLFSLAQGQFCILRIKAADTRSRRVVIETSHKIELVVHTNADGRKLAMKSEPKTGKPTEVSFGKEEQRIDFLCKESQNPCQVRLR